MSNAELDPGRPRGRPRDPDKDAAILEAAIALFLERGFGATSMDAIAERAGVSKMTLYARFKQKDELFAGALAAKCFSFMGQDVFEARAGEPVRTALVRICHAFLRLILDPHALGVHGLVMRESERDPAIGALFMEAAVMRVHRQMTSFLQRNTNVGRLSDEEAFGATWRLLGAVKGQVHMHAMLHLPPLSPEDLNRHVETCVDEFLIVHGRRGGGDA